MTSVYIVSKELSHTFSNCMQLQDWKSLILEKCKIGRVQDWKSERLEECKIAFFWS